MAFTWNHQKHSFASSVPRPLLSTAARPRLVRTSSAYQTRALADPPGGSARHVGYPRAAEASQPASVAAGKCDGVSPAAFGAQGSPERN